MITRFQGPQIKSNARRKVILVTGASAGLGLAIARELIADNTSFLVLTAREISQYRFFDESIFESPYIWLRNLDVVDHEQITTLIEEINEKLGGVDVLVNNAGTADRATVEESSSVYRQHQLDVNYLAPFELIGHVLSLMRKKRSGRIINISSVSGFMAMPTMSAYSASKFALEGASESLWYEMRPWSIFVTLIIPGFINSQGFLHTVECEACESSLRNSQSPYHEHYVAMKGLILKRMGRSLDTNEKIAAKIFHAINTQNPPLRLYVTLDAWVFYLIRKLCPPTLYFWLLYKFLPNVGKWGRQSYQA
jgi:short-subunit dehydrogenase